jgi:nickel-dependent lactate racemase
MRTLTYGRDRVEVDLSEDSLVPVRRAPVAPPLADPAAAVRAALEAPLGFPPLRRALTPDDHVAVVLDETLPRLPELLTALLEHLAAAGVSPGAVTVVTEPPSSGQRWVDDLSDAFEEVRVEVHDPADRKKLAYLATMRDGRRLYLNRTAVDADQVVVLGRPDADPFLARGGAGLLYPALADEATRQELLVADDSVPARREEAAEAAWLLGAPFLLQVVPGADDEVVHVVGGLVDTADEARRLYEGRWRLTVEELAETVVATVSGGAGRHDFAALARALAHAASVVQPDGRLVLLTRAAPHLGPGAEMLRRADDPRLALDALKRQQPPDLAAALAWAAATQRANVYLLSDLPAETAEGLFVTAIEHAGQLPRLLGTGGSCLILEDADRALPVLDLPEDDSDD